MLAGLAVAVLLAGCTAPAPAATEARSTPDGWEEHDLGTVAAASHEGNAATLARLSSFEVWREAVRLEVLANATLGEGGFTVHGPGERVWTGGSAVRVEAPPDGTYEVRVHAATANVVSFEARILY